MKAMIMIMRRTPGCSRPSAAWPVAELKRFFRPQAKKRNPMLDWPEGAVDERVRDWRMVGRNYLRLGAA
ncbi:MAG: hypothetical protein D6690_11105 [Nitrospirae bacterium]|nr:MAG: hypothetical protein D6690_11105 [Nitrospirota bacterium]